MPQDTQVQQQQAKQQQMTSAMLNGASQMFELQMTAMRSLMKTQARAAAAFGFPDYSRVLDGDSADDQIRQAISKGTEDLIKTSHQAGEALSDMQQQVARVAQTQAANAAQTWQQGMQQLSAQTEEAMQQLRQTTQQQTEQLKRSAEQANQAARDGLREGGEQLRQRLQEGGQRARETLSNAGDAQRPQTIVTKT